MLLLVHPPVARPSEPPAGIARLSGALDAHGVEHRLLDANIEGLLYLLRHQTPPSAADGPWTRRSLRNIEANIAALRGHGIYANIDKYKRAVGDIERLLKRTSSDTVSIGLANYTDKNLSPLRSCDLIRAAEEPELSPFYPYYKSRIEPLFLEREPDIIGISINYLSQALPAFSLIGFMRREFPEKRLVLGGGLITSWMRNPLWKNPFNGLVDNLVEGPGERKLLEILGISADSADTDLPCYNTLPLADYLSPGVVLPFSASSGCYWRRCNFCPENAEGNAYNPIAPNRVVLNLKYLSGTLHPELIHILDNCISPAVLEALIESPLGPKWYGFARVGPQLADQDFCVSLRNAGCVMIKLGIESGDQHVLDSLNKGISVETASVVLSNFRKAGIATYVYLMFGTPPEDEKSAEKTLEFAVQHAGLIDYLNLAIFNMPIFGEGFSDIRKRRFSEGDLSLYTDFVHPSGWDRKKVRQFLIKRFRRHPAISPILKREPAVFTSNHAPFFSR